jgi:long-chain acyl-CoA synthetase
MTPAPTGDLGWPLRRAARHHRDRLAVVDGERELSYGELAERVARLAGGLERLDLAPGDRVGYLGANSLAHLECVIGVPAHGRVLTDLNFRLAPAELAFMVEDAGVEVLVADRDNLAVACELRDRSQRLRALVLVGEGREPDCVPYENLVGGDRPGAPAAPGADDLAAISYTGGTTGPPKGVMLSHGNLLANARHNLLATGHTEHDVMLHTPPMFHAAGIANVFAATWVGAGQVIVPRFDPVAVATAIERHRVTLAILVPTMLERLLDHLAERSYDLASLRNLQYAASPISPEVQRRAGSELPGGLAQFYGMTEAAPTVTHLSPEVHERGLAGEEPDRSRLASAGIPVPGVEVELRRDDAMPAPAGEVGELWVRGPNVMLGYWNRPEDTAAALIDGWYRSGDLAYEDQDGYLFLVDRRKDMIISGGENVYSVEVERVLTGHPAVAQAAVFGIPDRRWGEAVHAVVVLAPGSDEEGLEGALVAHCRERIGGFKVPRSFDLRKDPLPQSGAGKVLKAPLREPYWSTARRAIG